MDVKTRVQICTPSLEGTPSIEYLTSLVQTQMLAMTQGILIDLNFIRGDQFISKARNGLIQGFLEAPSKPDVLFFIDDDEGWDPQAFIRMSLDSHGIVAAAVPKKSDVNGATEFNNVILDVPEGGGAIPVENGMLRARQIGTGFMAIKRWAIEKMIAAHPRQYAPGDGGPHKLHYALFDARIHMPDIGVGQFWGEDLDFCRNWLALGEYIWIDPNVTMLHVGRKVYSGNYLDFLRATCQVDLKEMTYQKAA